MLCAACVVLGRRRSSAFRIKTDFPTFELPMTANVRAGIPSPSICYGNFSKISISTNGERPTCVFAFTEIALLLRGSTICDWPALTEVRALASSRELAFDIRFDLSELLGSSDTREVSLGLLGATTGTDRCLSL